MSSELQEKLKPQREAVIFLLYRKGNVFIERRLKKGSGYYGYFIIPGGGVEEIDNTFEDAVRREAWEEKGVLVGNAVHLGSFVDASFSSGELKTSHAYLVNDFEGDPIEKEPEKAELSEVPIGDVDEYLEIASSKLIILWARAKLGI